MKKFDIDMDSIRRLVVKNMEEVDTILSDVPDEKAFWVNNGPIIKNIQDLPKVLDELDDEKFQYHANEEKNDFVKWIDEVVCDCELAKSLKKIKKRDTLKKRVQGRVEYLKSLQKKKKSRKESRRRNKKSRK